jgi:diguanylate cyclase (GGDEF)-like protein
VNPNRIRKRISRALKVSWREQPTRYDIEALQANTRRVGLVIKVRWALVIVLAVYSVFAAWVYTFAISTVELSTLMRVPAAALLFVVMYNTFYQATYRSLGNISVLNHAQLIFDALVVTVLVYYSGGVNSWFWSMYALFIFEAAFILPNARSTWLIAGTCALLLGFVVWGEYLDLLPQVSVPFVNNALYHDLTFVGVRYLWQVAVLIGSASVATLMMSAITSRERELQASSIIDGPTGLYNRAYFHRALAADVNRARRNGRPLFVVLVDLDHLGEFNADFGIERGDQLIEEVAKTISGIVTPAADSMTSANIVSRYGGEEFAIVLAEGLEPGSSLLPADARSIAVSICEAVAATRIDDVGVTASVGVAGMPGDGTTVNELLAAADEALGRAGQVGGGRVEFAEDGTA